jgi:hypothetical protein
MTDRTNKTFGLWVACALVAAGLIAFPEGLGILAAEPELRLCSTKLPDAVVKKLTSTPAAESAMPAESDAQRVKRNTELIVETGLQWANASTLRVKFINTPDTNLQQRIMDAASEWSKEANITFVAGNHAKSDIRISTVPNNRSWSYVGRDATRFAQDVPTMQFGWLTPTSSNEELSAVVLHEFGHALGAHHEHQHSESTMQWNEPVVLKACASMEWSEAECRFNILDRLSPQGLRFTRMDRTSIMMYAFPPAWTKNGVGTPWNTTLSTLDRQFIRTLYPRTAPQ